MSMTEVSESVAVNARKIEATVLQALSTSGQRSAAKALGLTDTAVSRLKDGQIAVVSQLLAFLGLKLVPADFKVVDPIRAQAMYTLYEAAISRMSNPADLLWEESEHAH